MVTLLLPTTARRGIYLLTPLTDFSKIHPASCRAIFLFFFSLATIAIGETLHFKSFLKLNRTGEKRQCGLTQCGHNRAMQNRVKAFCVRFFFFFCITVFLLIFKRWYLALTMMLRLNEIHRELCLTLKI